MKRFNIVGSLSLMLILALNFILPAAIRVEKVGIEKPGSGKNSWELIGRSVQIGPDIKHFGYLTHISGISEELLFSDPLIRTEATAKFTFFSKTSLTTHHERSSIIVTATPGNMGIYLQEIPNANLDDPSTFRNGDLIARFSVSYHSVLLVEQDIENWSSDTAVLELTQLIANQFNLEGKDLKFGKINLLGRLLISDQGLKTSDPFDYTGKFTVEAS